MDIRKFLKPKPNQRETDPPEPLPPEPIEPGASTSTQTIAVAQPQSLQEFDVNSDLPLHPYHPPASQIPTQVLSSRTLHFQQSWFDTFPWLHYVPVLKAVVCHTCLKATKMKIIEVCKQLENAFTTGGFTNWKKAREKFKTHQSSEGHLLAVSNLCKQGEKSIAS